MAKKITLEMTKPQLEAMCDLADTISGMIGVGSDFDTIQGKNLKLFDRMMEKNGYKRLFT